MRIHKILNNNTVVVIGHDQIETVVIGKGVAFGKRVGDPINMSIAEKTFRLSSDVLNTKFQEVLISLPMEHVTVVEKIVDEIKMSLGKKVSDSIYISLSDHIHFALINYERNILVKNNLLLDIMRFYPDEYALGQKGLSIIESETGVLLPDDEAGFIALHIVNAETEKGYGTKNVYKATKIIEEVLDVIKNYFGIEIDDSSLTYYRFINHLRYFSARIVSKSIFNDDEKDKELLQVLAHKYQDAYQCCLNVRSYINSKYKVMIGHEEMLYLTIHIQRAIFKEKEY